MSFASRRSGPTRDIVWHWWLHQKTLLSLWVSYNLFKELVKLFFISVEHLRVWVITAWGFMFLRFNIFSSNLLNSTTKGICQQKDIFQEILQRIWEGALLSSAISKFKLSFLTVFLNLITYNHNFYFLAHLQQDLASCTKTSVVSPNLSFSRLSPPANTEKLRFEFPSGHYLINEYLT